MALRRYVVVPPMEGALENLKEVANNLWFSWNSEAVDLFDHLDAHVWEESNHNPQQVLIRLSKSRFQEIQNDEGYRSHAGKVRDHFLAYMRRRRPYDHRLARPVNFTTAYFSPEFGLTESLPIYSGELGRITGDHLKSASDLNVPMVGIGLMYKEGYFLQRLSPDGWQEQVYVASELDTLPLERQVDGSGNSLRITVDLAAETLAARVLRVNVGRVPLFLLDADVPENPPHLRAVTNRLYPADPETRLRQEILLGMGGCRVLSAVGIDPAVYHLNEGHAAFALLERIRSLVEEKGLLLDEARTLVISQSVLTLHSPSVVRAEMYDRSLMERYFAGLTQRLGTDFESFFRFGRKGPADGYDRFFLPALGLRLTCRAAGISKIHAGVARAMWREVWPNADIQEVPIVPVTGGTHIPSYISRGMATLYERYLGPGWTEDPDNEKIWRRAEKIPDTELWRTHERCRAKLIHFARHRLRSQLQRRGASAAVIDRAERVLDPETLTICIGARFETSQRPDLIFKEPERLARMLNDAHRPIQLILGGKAYPNDDAGKAIMRSIVALAESELFRNRVVFLEDMDMNVSRYIVQGADVWLNTPRRPFEPCGVAGMSAAANGALNLSILNGWWAEGYTGENGWAVGSGEEYQDQAYQDAIESRALYDLLEENVRTLFYNRGVDELPREWIRMMKWSIASVCPVFNSHRMVADYVERFYVPSANNSLKLQENDFAALKEMVNWDKRLRATWDNIRVVNVEIRDRGLAVKGKDVEVVVSLDMAGHNPNELRVELIHGPIDLWDNFKVRYTTRLGPDKPPSSGKAPVVFSGLIPMSHTGLYGYEVRVTPEHANLPHSKRFDLILRG